MIMNLVMGHYGGSPRGFGEQWNKGIKGQILRGTGEQRQYWGTENIENKIFDFWGTGEQANLFQGNKEQVPPPPWEGFMCSKLYKVYINDDSELTLTHFKTMPNVAKLIFVLIVGPDIR